MAEGRGGYTKILPQVQDSLEDRLKMQKDLDRREHWALSNKMKFGGEKSKLSTHRQEKLNAQI